MIPGKAFIKTTNLNHQRLAVVVVRSAMQTRIARSLSRRATVTGIDGVLILDTGINRARADNRARQFVFLGQKERGSGSAKSQSGIALALFTCLRREWRQQRSTQKSGQGRHSGKTSIDYHYVFSPDND